MKTCTLYRNPYTSAPLGGGVVHKITLEGYSGRYSAFFDSTGEMVDAENVKNGRAVAKGSSLWGKIKIEASHLFRVCAKRGENSAA